MTKAASGVVSVGFRKKLARQLAEYFASQNTVTDIHTDSDTFNKFLLALINCVKIYCIYIHKYTHTYIDVFCFPGKNNNCLVQTSTL